jgi:RNA polymerase sigma factor (sigma-70 family)
LIDAERSSRPASLLGELLMPAIMKPVTDGTPFPTLLASARRKDPKALDELARRFYPSVERLVHHRLATDFRYARPWVSARFSTGDVVQSVFEGVLRDLGAFAGTTEESFLGYLSTVVRNRVLDAIRFHQAAQRDGRRGVQLSESGDGEGDELDPVDAAISAEKMTLLLATLEEFEPRVRHLLRARMEGLASFRELADQLGYGSESAARRAFFDAQAKLALRLGGDL